jgi:hypothetical protein
MQLRLTMQLRQHKSAMSARLAWWPRYRFPGPNLARVQIKLLIAAACQNWQHPY